MRAGLAAAQAASSNAAAMTVVAATVVRQPGEWGRFIVAP